MQATTAVRSLVFSVLFLLPLVLKADNCFITARPASEVAPVVFTWNDEDRLYVYCTQDIINGSGVYPVDTIHCYSTKDMFHWRDEGACLSEREVSWAVQATHKLWAAHVARFKIKILAKVKKTDTINGIPRDTFIDVPTDTTIYRLAASEDSSDEYSHIFTATSFAPAGPYTAGSPLPGMAKDVIDPFIFVDPGDSSVWMSYRHQNTRGLGFVRMDDSASSITGDINNALVNVGSGAPSGYMEGSCMIKRGDYYFLFYSFAPGSDNEMIAYSTSKTRNGPWIYRGKVMNPNSKPSEYTIHPGVCEFKGQWYLFYHNVTFGGAIFGACRSPGVEYLYFSNDSTVDTSRLAKTNRGVGVPRAGSDTIQVDRGVITRAISRPVPYNSTGMEKTGWYIDSINSGATVRYDSVDFTPADGNRIGVAFARIASNDSAGAIELRLDSATGLLLGTIPVDSTGSLVKWKTTDSIPLIASPPAGIHNLALVLATSVQKSYCVNWIGFGEIPEDAVLSRKVIAERTESTLRRIAGNRFILSGLGDAKTAGIRIYTCAGRDITGVAIAHKRDRHSILLDFMAGRVSAGVYIVSVSERGGTHAMRLRIDT